MADALDRETMRRCMAVAEEAKRMTSTLAAFNPTNRSLVHVCYGPAPFDEELPASAQPRAYTVFWMAPPGEQPPEWDEWVALDGEIDGTHMRMWVVNLRADVLRLVERHWGLRIELPEQEAAS